MSAPIYRCVCCKYDWSRNHSNAVLGPEKRVCLGCWLHCCRVAQALAIDVHSLVGVLSLKDDWNAVDHHFGLADGTTNAAADDADEAAWKEHCQVEIDVASDPHQGAEFNALFEGVTCDIAPRGASA